MSLSIVDLNNPKQISKVGTEYICTGFMFDVDETNESFDQQTEEFEEDKGHGDNRRCRVRFSETVLEKNISPPHSKG